MPKSSDESESNHIVYLHWYAGISCNQIIGRSEGEPNRPRVFQSCVPTVHKLRLSQQQAVHLICAQRAWFPQASMLHHATNWSSDHPTNQHPTLVTLHSEDYGHVGELQHSKLNFKTSHNPWVVISCNEALLRYTSINCAPRSCGHGHAGLPRIV